MQIGSGRVFILVSRRQFQARAWEFWLQMWFGDLWNVVLYVPFVKLLAGHDYAGEPTLELMIWPRPELQRTSDWGRIMLCLAFIRIDPVRWWRPVFWSDVEEITWRLAENAGARRP